MVSSSDKELERRFSCKYNELLGEGKFSKVYLAKDTLTEELVAIKLISKETLNNSPDLFKNEIELLKKVKSDAFIKIITSFHSDKGLHIVLELCAKDSLADVIKNKPFAEMEALDLVYQIVTAFNQLPEQGLTTSDGRPGILLHRDIKPGNILFKNAKLKIADLGLCEIVDTSKMNDQIFDKEAGTILYMSPQILKKLKYSTKTDIFSLGVVLYELIHQKLPWGKESNFVLSEKILTKEPEYRADLRKGTKDLLQGMLRPNDEDRLDWRAVARAPIFAEVQRIREENERYVFVSDAFRILRPVPITLDRELLSKLKSEA